VLQEWMKRGKIMTSARLSTEALESCFRCVICKGVKERATCVNRTGGFLLSAARASFGMYARTGDDVLAQ